MANKISDEVFEKLHHSVNMLHSLQNCHDTIVMNREDVDEKLFEELSNCEKFIKHFESVFLQIVNEDVQAISHAAVTNPDNEEQAEEMINSINSLIGKFNLMESEYIKRSEALRSTASQFREKLGTIRKDMEAKVKQYKKYRKDLGSEISSEFGHTTVN